MIFITLFSLAVLLIIYGLYYFFWRQPVTQLVEAPAQVGNGKGVPTTGLPTAKEGQPGVITPTVPSTAVTLPPISPVARGGLTAAPTLTTGAVLQPALAAGGQKLNFYDPAQGKFYRVGPDGKPQLMSNTSFYNVSKVTWSKQNDKGIIEYPDSSKILFDFNTGKQVTLPKHWQDFDFSSQSDQIAAKSIGTDPENRWLMVANADGSGARTVLPLGENADKVHVSWSPAGGVLGFSETGQALGLARQEIIPLGANQEIFRPLIVEGRDFRSEWSTSGDKLVYSVYNSDNNFAPTLWITNAQGDQMGTGRRKLNLATWADKCTFVDNDSLICAVPQDLPTGAGLQPDIAKDYPDSLYKIDLQTGAKSLLATTEEKISMGNLVVSKDKSALYFTDNNTGVLHTMKLQ